MKKSFVVIGVMVVVGLCALCGAVKAQEVVETPKAAYVEGTVVQVTDAELTVAEYNAEQDTTVDVSLVVTPETQVVNAEAIKDIVAGTKVVVDYTVDMDKKIAKTVTVKKSKLSGN